jgi:catechol 2,3-dioxygenase-like lactoylglutathione lyase family enzyme
MIKSFHHANIIIPKNGEEQARQFYGNLLGFKEIEKPEVLKQNGGLWFELGNTQLHLSYEKKEGFDPRKTNSHLAYEVEDLEHLEKLLKDQGHPTKRQVQIPGIKRFESEDPFGHRIEFLQRLDQD